jgi:RHS repeat-associated protein
VVVELGALAEYINEVRYDYTYTQLGRLRQAKTKRIGSGKPLGPQRLEDYSWDALGNRWKSHVHGLVGSATHPTISWYRHGTNRVTFSTPPSGTTDNVNINQSSYDAAGNVDWFGGTTYASGDQAVHIDESVTRSYYSADEKLHAAETRRCKSEVPLNSGTADEDPDPPYCLAPYLLSNAASGSFEWYRYDALGRRIMVRTRRDPWCGGAACSSTITRFIWDGDQVLAEIRGEGGADYSETPNQTGPQYGRVVYTHGGGLDQPLDIMRSSGVAGAASILLPIPTWRGTFVTATDSAGNMVCAPWVYCEITFTSAHSSAFLLPGAPVAGEYWYGSLAQGNENASGTIYMRNRYYNPQTGAFTQQDPIGLAGGLNTYGFANGDPVSYSDPYGLSASCDPPRPNCPETMAGQAHAAARRWFADAKDRALEIAGDVGRGLSEVTGVSDFIRAGFGWDPSGGEDVSGGQRLLAAGSLILTVGVPEGAVAANLNRTRRIAQGADVTVDRVGSFYRATWEIPGDGGGQSRAVWNKIINSEGRTVRMYKDSYDRGGRFQHRHHKFPDNRDVR